MCSRVCKEICQLSGNLELQKRDLRCKVGSKPKSAEGGFVVSYTKQEVLDFVKENDVKFVRLAFCDLLGRQKNISIMAEELPRAFAEGISFDASAIRGLADVSRSDLLLVPEPETLHLLPWRPAQGRVIRFFCQIKYPDYSPYPGDSRGLLQTVTRRLRDLGFSAQIGTECEFYLFKTDQDGYPTKTTHDEGEYMDISPLDRGENVRREICLTLLEMGIKPESSHHEQGPGQNEIDFTYSDPITAADHFLTFKSVVKAIAAQNGLFASFMPKPLEGQPGNGLHVNISVTKNGTNIFGDKEHSSDAESFISGILTYAREMSAFLNPTVNSYKRLGSFKAPLYVSWSHQNRSQLIRIPAAVGDKTRIELRSPDCTVNPYLAFAAVLSAGLAGINQKLRLPLPEDRNLYKAEADSTKHLEKLPTDLEEAVTLAAQSAFLKETLGADLIGLYLDLLREQLELYKRAPDKSEFSERNYFRVF